MRKSVVWAALLLAASTARAQERAETIDQGSQQTAAPQEPAISPEPVPEQQPTAPPSAQPTPSQQQAATPPSAQPLPGRQQALGPTSDAFNRACIDLLHGRMPEGEKAIRALKEACANLMAGRADERLEAERRRQEQIAAQEQLRLIAEGRRVTPGQAANPVEPGEGVLAAFGQAASELTSRQRMVAMGMRRKGPVDFTLVTNPIGYFTGLGVNAELFRPFSQAPKFSWVVGARYSTTDATNGEVSTFGAMGGADWFIIGRNNEGLRLGPRVEVAAGREDFGNDSTFARMGFGGEVGYNFIATNGITGLLAGGIGGRVAGDDENDDFESFVGGEFGPYIKLGLGYSW